MQIPAQCDVVIIGGGPAGSMAATYLCQAGYHVVLFDKQKHPRYQVGESLIPDFWKYCDDAGVSKKIVDEGFLPKAGGTVDWHGVIHRVAFKDFGYTRPALHIERDRFDLILLDHARDLGTQVFEEVIALSADFSQEDRVQVLYRPVTETALERITCRYVVDASGQNTVIGRQLDVRIVDEAFRFMSVWGYFTNASYVAADGHIHPASSVRTVAPTTYVTALPLKSGWGWCWDIILRENTSVGLILPLEEVQTVKQDNESWERYFLRQCEALPLLSRLLADAHFCPDSVRLIRDYSYRATHVAGSGFFLIGDAAGFIDPIFSVGMVLAMYSARAVAWAIDRIYKSPRREAEYQAIFTQQLQGRLELGRTLAWPRYTTAGPASEQAREAVQFASPQAQELMYAASLMTARSHNFSAMVSDETIQAASRQKLHVIDRPID